MNGSLGNDGLNHSISDDALGMLDLGDTGIRTTAQEESGGPTTSRSSSTLSRRALTCTCSERSISPAPCAEWEASSAIGVTVCDARAAFATHARFPDADEIVVRWPHEFLPEAHVDKRTVICVLTHDPKFDVPVIKEVLVTKAAYIGAMGSRRTHEDRRRRLIEAGVDERLLGRISSPIGLDIGRSTPEEVAVAIAGEIIALRHGADGGRLRDQDR